MKFTQYFFTWISIVMMWASAAQADFVCETKTQFGKKAVITLQKEKATVEISDNEELIFKSTFEKINEVWDGHMTGLITAKGFALKYENHFGVIRNVVIFTDVRGNANGSASYIDTLEIAECASR